MLTDQQRTALAKPALQMQIIVAAMAAGVAIFLTVALTIVQNQPAANPLIAYIAVGFAVLAFALWLVVPNILVIQARKAIADDRVPIAAVSSLAAGDADVVDQLVAVFQTRLIIGCALLEGAAFFNLVAYMLEAHQLSLCVAVALLLGILIQIPTRNRLEVWITHQLEIIEQLRM